MGCSGLTLLWWKQNSHSVECNQSFFLIQLFYRIKLLHFPHSLKCWVLCLLHDMRLSSISWFYCYFLAGLHICHAISFPCDNVRVTLRICSVDGFLLIFTSYMRLVYFILRVQFEKQVFHVLSMFCSLRKWCRKENSSAKELLIFIRIPSLTSLISHSVKCPSQSLLLELESLL